MDLFHLALILSAFLCSLVAGFLFAYAIVIMPGFKTLDNKAFIKAFQVTDTIIQNNQPLFIFVWLGSALALILSAFLGFDMLHGLNFILFITALFAYVFGVQALTIIIHLPLNKQLQSFNTETMNESELQQARLNFESRWNKFNLIRTAITSFVSLLLIILLFRL